MADQDDRIEEENLNEEDEQLDQSQEEAQEELQDEEEQQEEEQLEEDDQEDDQEEKPAEKPSRREQLRINDLLRKYGPPEERQAPQTAGVNYRDMIDADDEVYEKLENASRQSSTEAYQLGLREADKVKFETRLEVDNARVEANYPQLNKYSEDFNPGVANAINNMYLSAVGYDPKTGYVQNANLRYGEYVEAMFELVSEAADRKIEKTRRNVTRQASRTGIRPDGSSSRAPLDLNKNPADMTDKELDAVLAKNGLAPKKR